jgi:hypothetical protein
MIADDVEAMPRSIALCVWSEVAVAANYRLRTSSTSLLRAATGPTRLLRRPPPPPLLLLLLLLPLV